MELGETIHVPQVIFFLQGTSAVAHTLSILQKKCFIFFVTSKVKVQMFKNQLYQYNSIILQVECAIFQIFHANKDFTSLGGNRLILSLQYIAVRYVLTC